MPHGLQGFLELRLTIRNLLLVVGYAVAWRLICSLAGLYDEKRIKDRAAEARRILVAVTTGSALALIFPLISVTRAFNHESILFYWVGCAACMLVFRAASRALLHAPLTQRHDVVIVGSGPRALTLYYTLFGANGNGFRLWDSSIPQRAKWRRRFKAGYSATSTVSSHPHGSRSGRGSHRPPGEVSLHGNPAHDRDLRAGRGAGQIPRPMCSSTGATAISPVGEPLTAVAAHASSEDGRLIVKRCLDVALAILALVCTAPILLLSALAIKVTSPGPILFIQERYGLNKRRFRMYKFRTMVADAETQQHLLEEFNEATGPVFKIREDPRLTRVGKILRRLSIDEMPQLLNVLRGEMSLVGPRPLPMRDVSGFSEPALMRRFSVYPGITGLWQVSGRSDLSFDDWIRLDLRYIDHWSLYLDLQILLRTIPSVINGRGAV